MALQSADGTHTYGSLIITNVTDGWTQYTGILTSNATDSNSRLAITVAKNQAVLMDVVSLFPEENGYYGSTSLWRKDLFQHLLDLKPRFIRFPGGCLVEVGRGLF